MVVQGRLAALGETVFLTGATGFLGRHLLNQILASGEVSVRALVRNPQSTIGRLETEGVALIKGDMFNMSKAEWVKAIGHATTVIHAAWYVKPRDFYFSRSNADSLQATINLGMVASSLNVKRFVGIGTCAEYKEQVGPLSIASPLMPRTPYAQAKASAFFGLSAIFSAEQSRSNFLWCRLFNPYGETLDDGEPKEKLVSYLHHRLSKRQEARLSAGHQIRDFLPIQECARKIWLLTKSNYTGPANICSGIPCTVRQKAEEIASIYDAQELLKFEAARQHPSDPFSIVGVPTNHDP